MADRPALTLDAAGAGGGHQTGQGVPLGSSFRKVVERY